MYQYILFDLDGTLTDSKEGLIKSLQYALDKLNEPPLPESTLLAFIGPPLQDSFMKYCGFSPEKATEAIRIFRERYVPIGKFENKPAPGMLELCRSLKEHGCKLALASSKPQALCEPICQRFGFAEHLEHIVGSPPEADWGKTDVIREALRKLAVPGSDYDRVLMVGDRKYDVIGARECGIACAGTEFFGYAEPGELAEAGAVVVVQSAAELEAFILADS